MLRFSYKYGVRYVYAEREQCRIGCVELTFTRVALGPEGYDALARARRRRRLRLTA